jgi:tRNA nucleotidyltransferase (CCA-adding enzyme)
LKIYCVGGAVRDELLGEPGADRDWVVVGATPQQMLDLGYKAVGRDFPVFLHPETHEEYALARTERKTARGYRGFEFHAAPDVTLEQDLQRRDLTINAIARDEAGALIDPHGGVADLKARVLRHVGPAFVEDPVRILRLARFAARFDFTIAPETAALMRAMVVNHEVDALVAERVWQELARGLVERRPSRMLQVLHECGALRVVVPEFAAVLDAPDSKHALQALDRAAAAGLRLDQRFAVVAQYAAAEEIEALCARLRVPQECRDLALLAARHCSAVSGTAKLDAARALALLQKMDAWRRPERFERLLAVCELTARRDTTKRRTDVLRASLSAVQALDAGAVAKAHGDPKMIQQKLAAARRDAIARALAADSPTSPSKGTQMIELYTWSTPNGRKVSIMLEETGLPYRAHAINIGKDDQFTAEFIAINPNSKIPAIVDPEGPDGGPYPMMESGAILVYLAGKAGKLLPQSVRGRYDALQWLMFQMGGVGPMFGQVHHFLRAAKEPVPYAIERYKKETRRLYGVLDGRLAAHEYLADSYSIADIATYPWVARHEWHQVDLADFSNVKRWYDAISARPAVQRGMNVPAAKT